MAESERDETPRSVWMLVPVRFQGRLLRYHHVEEVPAWFADELFSHDPPRALPRDELPGDFPHREVLEAAGITTYTELDGVDDYTSIKGIGDAKAADIEGAWPRDHRAIEEL